MYTKEEIIKMSQEVHGDKYDYSLVEDIQNKLGKIKYRCIKHDYIHEQTFHNHLQGKGCPICAKESRRIGKLMSKDEFLKKASKKRKDLDKYDLDKIDYTFRDENGRMEMYCKEHGRFLIRPAHFFNGVGCQLCNGRQKNDDEVRKELSHLHPTLDFSETKYSERDKYGNIKVICPEHGTKYMRYWNLLNGEGCYECSMKKNGLDSRLSNEEIIKRAKEIYGKDTYTFDKLDNQNRREDKKVIITCPKHGDFFVNLSNFISGKSGCPVCNERKLEREVRLFLTENNINFEFQKHFDWLGKQSLDFYLPDYNIGIECQGIQHFEPKEYFGDEEGFKVQFERDNRKKQLCDINNVNLIYYMRNKFVKNNNDFFNLTKMLLYIKNNAQN